jgi:hypothetical protein
MNSNSLLKQYFFFQNNAKADKAKCKAKQSEGTAYEHPFPVQFTHETGCSRREQGETFPPSADSIRTIFVIRIMKLAARWSWRKVVSFDRSLLKGDAPRFLEKSTRPPSFDNLAFKGNVKQYGSG